jgi:thiamine pyrophosphate-dependent acetolactate synthase large subunit-like protein
VSTYKTGTSAFQEVPTTEIYRPITKGAFAVTSAEQVGCQVPGLQHNSLV